MRNRMSLSNLQHKERLVALSHYSDHFIEFLEECARTVSDATVELGQGDTLESRRNMSDFLKKEIDNIKRIRDNALNPPEELKDQPYG
jgi:hypothetical protein